jgi:hypothetical protein
LPQCTENVSGTGFEEGAGEADVFGGDGLRPEVIARSTSAKSPSRSPCWNNSRALKQLKIPIKIHPAERKQLQYLPIVAIPLRKIAVG